MNSQIAHSASLVPALVFAALSLVGDPRGAPSEATSAELQQIAREAYVYAYSPVYAYRFLQDEVFNCEFACNTDPLRGVFASKSDPL